MSSDPKNEIAIRVKPSSLPDTLKGIKSLHELFNLAVGDNCSILDYDLESDGWPTLEEIDSPEIQKIMNGFYDDIDAHDSSSLNKFADDALDGVESLYRRFGQNDLVNSQIDHLRALIENGVQFDGDDFQAKLAPLFIDEEDLKPNFWDRMFGETQKEMPTTQDIKSALVDIELDLNAQSAEIRGITVKTERLIHNIAMQKEALEKAQADMQQAETMLFLGYAAGRKLLAEWHSDEVTSCYIGKSPFDPVAESVMDDMDTEFFMPTTPRKWADYTFALNMRLTHFRNVYTKNQEFLVDIPARIAAIDELMESYKNANTQSTASWQNTSQSVKDMIEFIRVEQRLIELRERADVLVKSDENHKKFMSKIETTVPATKPAANDDTTKTKPPTAYERIVAQSSALKAQFLTKAEAIESEYARYCDISDHYRVKMDKAPIKRPDGFVQHVREAHQAINNKKPKRWGIL